MSFNGKAIYNPSGKAGEYSYWACNFYVGCSNGCTYCYLKKGRSAKCLGGIIPTLKKCFRDEAHAIQVFEKELLQNLEELKKHGLFFSFTTDPMLPETMRLTMLALAKCIIYEVPVKILTKNANFVDFGEFPFVILNQFSIIAKQRIAFGFTVTGHDELEPGASTNAERIEAMEKLKEAGFRTFASIEPIVDLNDSLKMIFNTLEFCNLFKIGLMSGEKYDIEHLHLFKQKVHEYTKVFGNKVYYKDSFLKQANLPREAFSGENYVTRDYNIFKN